MIWLFDGPGGAGDGRRRALRPGPGRPADDGYDDRPDVAGPGRSGRWARPTSAGCASRWPSGATGCRRSTRFWTGWPGAGGRPSAEAAPCSSPRVVAARRGRGHSSRVTAHRLCAHRPGGRGRRVDPPPPPKQRRRGRPRPSRARPARRAHRPGVLALVDLARFSFSAPSALNEDTAQLVGIPALVCWWVVPSRAC